MTRLRRQRRKQLNQHSEAALKRRQRTPSFYTQRHQVFTKAPQLPNLAQHRPHRPAPVTRKAELRNLARNSLLSPAPKPAPHRHQTAHKVLMVRIKTSTSTFRRIGIRRWEIRCRSRRLWSAMTARSPKWEKRLRLIRRWDSRGALCLYVCSSMVKEVLWWRDAISSTSSTSTFARNHANTESLWSWRNSWSGSRMMGSGVFQPKVFHRVRSHGPCGPMSGCLSPSF